MKCLFPSDRRRRLRLRRAFGQVLSLKSAKHRVCGDGELRLSRCCKRACLRGSACPLHANEPHQERKPLRALDARRDESTRAVIVPAQEGTPDKQRASIPGPSLRLSARCGSAPTARRFTSPVQRREQAGQTDSSRPERAELEVPMPAPCEGPTEVRPFRA